MTTNEGLKKEQKYFIYQVFVLLQQIHFFVLLSFEFIFALI